MNIAAALHLLMVFNGKNRIRQRNKNSIEQNSCTYIWETSLKLLQFQYKLLHIQHICISLSMNMPQHFNVPQTSLMLISLMLMMTELLMLISA